MDATGSNLLFGDHLEPLPLTLPDQSSSVGYDMTSIFFIQIVVFLFIGYFQYMLSKKMNIRYSWMAFVPVLNIVNWLWIGGKSLPKYIILLLVFLGLAIFGPVLIFVIGPFAMLASVIGVFGLLGLALSILDGVSKRTGHGFFWALGLLFLLPIMLPLTAITYTPEKTVVQ